MSNHIHKSRKSRSRRKRPRFDFSTVEVKCSFCHNTFFARPKDAICPKCDRPANRPLPLPWRVFSLLLPPLGLVYALVIRRPSPFAALQSLQWALGGAAIFAAWFLLARLN